MDPCRERAPDWHRTAGDNTATSRGGARLAAPGCRRAGVASVSWWSRSFMVLLEPVLVVPALDSQLLGLRFPGHQHRLDLLGQRHAENLVGMITQWRFDELPGSALAIPIGPAFFDIEDLFLRRSVLRLALVLLQRLLVCLLEHAQRFQALEQERIDYAGRPPIALLILLAELLCSCRIASPRRVEVQ